MEGQKKVFTGEESKGKKYQKGKKEPTGPSIEKLRKDMTHP